MSLKPSTSELMFANMWWKSKDYLTQRELARRHGAVRNSLYIGKDGLREYGPKSIVNMYRKEGGM